jgi:Flp pilus assembly protein TadB
MRRSAVSPIGRAARAPFLSRPMVRATIATSLLAFAIGSLLVGLAFAPIATAVAAGVIAALILMEWAWWCVYAAACSRQKQAAFRAAVLAEQCDERDLGVWRGGHFE